MARALVVAGLLLVAVGLLLSVAPGALSWFGRLPGDVRIERGNYSLYLPFTSLLLVSVALSLLVGLLFRR